jgi:hypothetical protein
MLDRLRIYQFYNILADYFCFKKYKNRKEVRDPEGLGKKNFEIETQSIKI